MRPPVFRGVTIAALIASSLAHMLAPSGTAAAEEGVAADALAPGSWSVQFSVQPNFTLGSYSGSTLSLKRHLASGNAIRFGLSVNLQDRSDNLADVSGDTITTFTQSNAIDVNSWSIGAGADYLWYAGRAAPIHAYWGGGPTISWSRGHDQQSQRQTVITTGQPPAIGTTSEDLRVRGWRAGIAAAAGVEWLVARRVGLFAEYGSSFVYVASNTRRRSTFTSTSSSPRTGDSERDAHRWDFSGSGGRLGVSVYY